MGRGGTERARDIPRLRGAREAENGVVAYLGTLSFAPSSIARGVRLGLEEILNDYRGNARYGSRLLERRVAQAFGGEVTGEGADHDVLLADGRRFEVRCFTSSISFAPSNTVGSGRRASAGALKAKLDAVDGFVVCDMTRFPLVESWLVPARVVKQWCAKGVLGKNGRMAAAKFRGLVRDAPPAQLATNGGRAGVAVVEDSSLHVAVSLEYPIECAPLRRELLRAPIGPGVFGALSHIKMSALHSYEDQEHDPESAVYAAHFILDALVTPEVLSKAGETLSIDVVQFFQLVRTDGELTELLLDVAAERNLIDLVARYADGPSPALAMAFADCLATGWVANSSVEARAAGYAEEDPFAESA
jgi:hypothetical protein